MIYLLLWLTILFRNSYCEFGCKCAIMEKSYEDSKRCALNLKPNNTHNKLTEKVSVDGRIVGGYDVMKECMPRPFLVLIRVKNRRGAVSDCMGVIINRRFVLTASHCFCDQSVGLCRRNNGKKSGEKHRSGHPLYEKGSEHSTTDPTVIPRVTILLSGMLDSYSFYRLIEHERDPVTDITRKVKNITIHPDYVNKMRDQNDVALIEVDKDFDFSNNNVQPICLPKDGQQTTDMPALVTGYGMLYERSKNLESPQQRGACNTAIGGPEEFRKCRDFLVVSGIMYETKTTCIDNIPSPSMMDPDCKELIKQRPEFSKMQAVIDLGNGTKKTCHSNPDGILKWCGVCVKGAKSGEPGYCDPEETVDSDYSDTRNDVSTATGWGFCDKMCHSDSLRKDKLQETELFVLSDEDCDNRTKKYLASEDFSMRPMADREACAASRKITVVTIVKKDGDKFVDQESEEKVVWGGSDSCQGDSGGPLWIIDENKVARVIGVTNRGEGCARKDSYGIYAKIAFHKEWILKNANSGRCTHKKCKRKKK